MLRLTSVERHEQHEQPCPYCGEPALVYSHAAFDGYDMYNCSGCGRWFRHMEKGKLRDAPCGLFGAVKSIAPEVFSACRGETQKGLPF